MNVSGSSEKKMLDKFPSLSGGVEVEGTSDQMVHTTGEIRGPTVAETT